MRRCLAHVHTLATASLGQHTAPLPLLAQVQSVASTSCSPSSTINSPSCSSHSSSSSSSSAGPQRHFSCGEAGPSSTHSFSLHSLAPSLPHHHHHQQRSHSSSFASSSSSRRAFSTPAAGEEQDVDKIGNEKVQRLAAEVLGLTVLESSQLSTILRKKLDIPKPTAFGGAMPAFPAAGMPGMGGPAGPQPAGQQAEGAAAPEPPKAKTEFDVKLDSFTADGKIKVIKEIRALTNLGLKEAKELVEKAPIVLKSGVPKEDAENWKKVIETAGGKVELA